MPKGKKSNTQDDFDGEVSRTAQRMLKRPEARASARTSRAWYEFLDDIGVFEGSTESERGQRFWGSVRQNVRNVVVGITPKWIAERGAEVESGLYRDAKGRITKESTGSKPAIVLRDKSTGRFTSVKKLQHPMD